MITTKLLGCALTAVSCVALLNGYKPAGITAEMVAAAGAGGDDGRLLLESAGLADGLADGGARALSELAGGGGADDVFPVWIFMSLGILIEMMFFFDALTRPDEELSILMIMINRMLTGDIFKFMKVFTIVFVNYGFAMYICYPRVGDVFLPQQSPEFNSISAAIQTLVQLALLGDVPKVDLSVAFDDFSTGQVIEFWAYIGFLFLYLIMALILLLNLLIAMMGDTYATVQEQAVREWRVGNAQMILRLEMLARAASPSPTRASRWAPTGRSATASSRRSRRARRRSSSSRGPTRTRRRSPSSGASASARRGRAEDGAGEQHFWFGRTAGEHTERTRDTRERCESGLARVSWVGVRGCTGWCRRGPCRWARRRTRVREC